MPALVSSQKMFKIGLWLTIIGVIAYIVGSPLLDALLNEFGYSLPIGLLVGLTSAIQQGALFSGVFLMVGSFIARAAEDAVSSLNHEQPAPEDLGGR
ncbi:hypothetical protein CQ018_11150 [Arthrobacter sp. MYb227]|uniref:hypothetical protein n=1 Tax=Arthrobacter sp. MYb227 TaxID=1848601 RepID=UPI000CFE0A1F|nr:hypothetical protein [Arthrobacter sp. MYb227]PQZ93005.1 hypothetical protein CQ018_11150 [Arthrobacter sp. MYb227]